MKKKILMSFFKVADADDEFDYAEFLYFLFCPVILNSQDSLKWFLSTKTLYYSIWSI